MLLLVHRLATILGSVTDPELHDPLEATAIWNDAHSFIHFFILQTFFTPRNTAGAWETRNLQACSGREDTGNKTIAGLSGCLLGGLCQVLSGDHLVLRKHYEVLLLGFPVCRWGRGDRETKAACPGKRWSSEMEPRTLPSEPVSPPATEMVNKHSTLQRWKGFLRQCV